MRARSSRPSTAALRQKAEQEAFEVSTIDWWCVLISIDGANRAEERHRNALGEACPGPVWGDDERSFDDVLRDVLTLREAGLLPE